MLTWCDSYSTGNMIIDNQHKRLFEIAGDIESILISECVYDMYDLIVEKLDELKYYTEYHFETEEGIMQMFQFSGIAEHKEIHELFLNNVESVYDFDIDADQEETAKYILMFLVDWLKNHILHTDIDMVKEIGFDM